MNEHNIEIRFVNDERVINIENLPIDSECSKFIFYSYDDKKYNRGTGRKKIKVIVKTKDFEHNIATRDIFLEWDEQVVIKIHKFNATIQEAEDGKNEPLIYFIKKGIETKDSLFKNLETTKTLKQIITEVQELKIKFQEIDPTYLTIKDEKQLVRLTNEVLMRKSKHKKVPKNYVTKDDIDVNFQGDFEVKSISSICFKDFNKITEWEIEDGIEKIL